MSFRINPFTKFQAPKKSAISKTSEREFEREIKKLEILEENTKKIHKDMKKCCELQSAQIQAEQDIVKNLGSSAVCKEEERLKELLDGWNQSTKRLEILSDELNALSNKVVSEPMKKFATIFPCVQQVIKRREQILVEYSKCCEKMDKYSKRERTGQNVVKLELSRQAYAAAKQAYDSHNEQLMSELPRLYEGRIIYIQPSLNALVKAQMKYYTDTLAVYSALCTQLESRSQLPVSRSDTEQLRHSIQTRLGEIRALSITADDTQLPGS